MAFLKLVVNMPWRDVQQFPVHIYFATAFSRLDAVVRRLGMVAGYGHYLLASSRFRQCNASRPMQWTVARGFDSMKCSEDGPNGEERPEKLTAAYHHGLDLEIQVLF